MLPGKSAEHNGHQRVNVVGSLAFIFFLLREFERIGSSTGGTVGEGLTRHRTDNAIRLGDQLVELRSKFTGRRGLLDCMGIADGSTGEFMGAR